MNIYTCFLFAFLCIANGVEDNLSVEDTTVTKDPQYKCQQITVPFCIDMPYNTTIMPNMLGHRNQEDAGLEIHQYFPLIKIGCSPDLQLFLCSVYFPVCATSEKSVPPCRSLCLKAKSGCEGVMLNFGFKWPDNLNCDLYPDNSSLCVGGVNTRETLTTTETIEYASVKPDYNMTKRPLDECQQITVPFCIDVPYNTTIMPNMLGHRSQEEAGLEVHQYFPLIKIQCSPDLQLFLCSVYFPVCTTSEKSVPPCRSLCLSAKSGCEGVMLMYGMKWPDNLNCDLYPDNSSLCVEGVNTRETLTTTETIKYASVKPDYNMTKRRLDECQQITVPFCMDDIPYNTTIMPNMLGHKNQEDAGLEIYQYFPLIKIGCSPDLQPFLCSVYFPVCTTSEKSVPPCRSLCLSAKSGCEGVMLNFGFKWPDNLNCDIYPDNSNGCVGSVNTTETLIATTETFGVSPRLEHNFSVENTTLMKDPQYKCQETTVPSCLSVPYNTTIMPNMLGHKSQDQAGEEMHFFWPLIEIACSPDLRLFLCSVYVPVCTILERPVPPCRSLCLSAKSGCEGLMLMYGFKWPDNLNCDLYPDNSNECINTHNFTETHNTTETIDYKRNMTKRPQDKCQQITVPFCMDDIPYNATIMPNMLGHKNQEEAGLEILNYFPLIKIKCSPDLQLFLCSVYFPVCTTSEKSVPPCRSLCLSAKSGCEGVMLNFGFKWPDNLNCDLYPDNLNGCIDTHNFTESHNTTETIHYKTNMTKLPQDKCQQITVPFCMDDIPYNATIMPNMLGHKNQEEAGLEILNYFPLIKIKCSPDLQLFLCSVYFPVCTTSEKSVPPCRSLCLSAKSGCEGVMLNFGFKWPDNLNCDLYPDNSNGCIDTHNSGETHNTTETIDYKRNMTKRPQDKCQQITVYVCLDDIPYNTTIMPNVLGHKNQEDAGLEVHQYFPLIQIGCSPDLQLFLCSVYFPVCTTSEKPVPPCRSLCLSAKSGCEGIMLMYGFKWPDNLNCDLYPDNSDVCVDKHYNFTETLIIYD